MEPQLRDCAAAVGPRASLQQRQSIAKAALGCQRNHQQLSELYDIARTNFAAEDDQLPTCVMAACAALNHLQLGTERGIVLQQFYSDVFLSLAEATDGSDLGLSLLDAITGLVQQYSHWQQATAMIQHCCSSMAASAALQWQPAPVPPSNTHWAIAGSSSCSPPATAAHLAVQLLRTAAAAAADGDAAAAQTCMNASDLLFTLSVQQLVCSHPQLRRLTMLHLLPAALSHAAANTRHDHMRQLWHHSLTWLTQPGVPRRMGLALLLHSWDAWGIPPPPAHLAAAPAPAGSSSSSDPPPSSSSSSYWQDAAEVAAFWSLLRCCLVDPEPLNRKRAFRLLQLLLPPGTTSATTTAAWGVLLSLYELLDEFAAHLVKAAWPGVARLHAAAPQYAVQDAAWDVTASSKKNMLRRAADGPTAAAAAAAAAAGGEGAAAAGAGEAGARYCPPLDVAWSAVLWQRALQHENLQVQIMALKTFLKRCWSSPALQQLPISFLIEVLLPALTSPIHHKTPTPAAAEPAPHINASEARAAGQHKQQPLLDQDEQDDATAGFNVTEAAGQLLVAWVGLAPPDQQRRLLGAGLQLLGGSEQTSRPGLLSLLTVVATAAGAAGPGLLEGCSDPGAWCHSSLSHTSALLSRLHSYHGATFRTTATNLLLQLGAVVAPPSPACQLEGVGALLGLLPPGAALPGGCYGPQVAACLTGATQGQQPGSWLHQEVTRMWQQYWPTTTTSPAGRGTASAATSSKDWEEWSSTAATLSTALFHLPPSCATPLLSQLADKAEGLASRSYLGPSTPTKALLILKALLAAGRATAAAQQPGHGTSSSVTAVQVAGGNKELVQQLTQLVVRLAGPLADTLQQQYQAAVAAAAPRDETAAAARLAAARQALLAGEVVGGAGELLLWQLHQLQHQHPQQQHQQQSSSGGAVPCGSGGLAGTSGALRVLLVAAGGCGEVLPHHPLTRLGLGSKEQQQQQVDVPWHCVPAVEDACACLVQTMGACAQLLLAAARTCGTCQGVTCHLDDWTRAVLRETRAAQQAHQAWKAARTAQGIPPTAPGTPPAPRVAAHGADWAALYNLLQLQEVLSGPPSPASAPAVGRGLVGATQQVAAVVAGAHHQQLSGATWVDLLLAAAAAATWTPEDRGLLGVVHCVREAWAAVVADGSGQLAAEAWACHGSTDGTSSTSNTSSSTSTSVAAGSSAITITSSSSTSAAQDHATAVPDSSNTAAAPPAAQPPLAGLCQLVVGAALGALSRAKKRSSGLCAALVSTLLLPPLWAFDPALQPHLVALHLGPAAGAAAVAAAAAPGASTDTVLAAAAGAAAGGGGPLSHALRQLLLSGAKSPRLLLVVALCLGRLLLAAPLLARWYTQELLQLLMFGVPGQGGPGCELDLRWGEVVLAPAPPLVPPPLDPELQAQFDLVDLGPRVATATALYQLAVAAGLEEPQEKVAAQQQQQGQQDQQQRSAAVAAGQAVWRALLQVALRDPQLSTDKFKTGSTIHRNKVRLWQALTVCSSFVTGPGDAQEALTGILQQLSLNNPPSVKQYQEATAVRLCAAHPHLLPTTLLPRCSDYTRGSAATASVALIAAQALLQASPDQQQQMLPRFLLVLLPWCNHHNNALRTFAQLIVYELLQVDPGGGSSSSSHHHQQQQQQQVEALKPAAVGQQPSGAHQLPTTGITATTTTTTTPVLAWWSAALGPGAGGLLAQQLLFMDTNIDLVRLRRGLAPAFRGWRLGGVTAPRRVFHAGVQLAGSELAGVPFEGVPPGLMDQLGAFLAAERAKLREANADRLAAFETAPALGPPTTPGGGVGGQGQQSTSSSSNSNGPARAASTAAGAAQSAAWTAAGEAPPATDGGGGGVGPDEGAVANYQRKVTPTERLALSADLYEPAGGNSAAGGKAGAGGGAAAGGGGGGAGGQQLLAALEQLEETGGQGAAAAIAGAPLRPPRHDLLLVASLIDKAPNLAGLARTAEVLGAGALVLGDLGVVGDPQFTSISVTAERWVPLLEVPEAALLGWLDRKRAQGYTLIGLEQTAESVVLQEFTFPPRVVLVLGREKEGLPPQLLDALDTCLEIPQLGVIRSLNVHVSGAIALYEYLRQQRGGEGARTGAAGGAVAAAAPAGMNAPLN